MPSKFRVWQRGEVVLSSHTHSQGRAEADFKPSLDHLSWLVASTLLWAFVHCRWVGVLRGSAAIFVPMIHLNGARGQVPRQVAAL